MSRPEVLATWGTLLRTFGGETFTTQDAVAVGIPQYRLSTAERAGVIHRLAQGRYRVKPAKGSPSCAVESVKGSPSGGTAESRGLSALEVARVEDRIAELGDSGIGALLGTASAAQSWELPTYQVDAPAHPVLLVPRGSPVRPGLCRGIRISLRDVDRHDAVVGPGGIAMTSPLLTALHVAASPGLGLPGRLVVLHGGLRRHWEMLTAGEGRMSSRDLASAMSDPRVRDALLEESALVAARADIEGRGASRGRGPAAASAWRRLDTAMRIADPRIETALESLSWAHFHAWGLQMPVPQARLRGASGAVWRVDFLFEGRVVGECDGAIKYRDGYTAWEEKRRQADLEAEGYVFVRWTWGELLHHPERVRARIGLALSRVR